jgi:hypothetical protein
MATEKPKNRAGQTRGNGGASKFPEPSAWALRWNLEHPGDVRSEDEETHSAGKTPKRGDGRPNKFPEPRGWSLEWDGASMAAIQEFYDRGIPGPGPKSNAGEA